jgi:hypothetical protein
MVIVGVGCDIEGFNINRDTRICILVRDSHSRSREYICFDGKL